MFLRADVPVHDEERAAPFGIGLLVRVVQAARALGRDPAGQHEGGQALRLGARAESSTRRFAPAMYSDGQEVIPVALAEVEDSDDVRVRGGVAASRASSTTSSRRSGRWRTSAA